MYPLIDHLFRITAFVVDILHGRGMFKKTLVIIDIVTESVRKRGEWVETRKIVHEFQCSSG